MPYDPHLKAKNKAILYILTSLIIIFFVISFIRTKESSWSTALKKQHLLEEKRKQLSKK